MTIQLARLSCTINFAIKRPFMIDAYPDSLNLGDRIDLMSVNDDT